MLVFWIRVGWLVACMRGGCLSMSAWFQLKRKHLSYIPCAPSQYLCFKFTCTMIRVSNPVTRKSYHTKSRYKAHIEKDVFTFSTIDERELMMSKYFSILITSLHSSTYTPNHSTIHPHTSNYNTTLPPSTKHSTPTLHLIY